MKNQTKERQQGPFQVALDYLLFEKEHGTAVACAEYAGIKPAYLSQIRHGVKQGSPKVRTKIVEFFPLVGMDDQQFLKFGEWILDGEDPDYFISYLQQSFLIKERITLKLGKIFKFDGTVDIETKLKVAGELSEILLEKELISTGFEQGHLRIGIEEQYSEMLATILDKDDEADQIDDFTTVPKYQAKLSGGPGSLETSDQIEANLMFRTEFLSRKGQVDKMALFEVTGESMQPFIYDGDVVLVDTSVNNIGQIVAGKTYAFRENSTVLIKRLSVQGGAIIASSENHQMNPPYHLDTDSFNLIGRVVWVGHEVT